jgi:hypothetical protein
LETVTELISPYVVEEVSAGDPAAAKQRLDAIRHLSLLDTNDEIEALAEFLLLGGGLPPKARFDALHIACAAYHRVDVVLLGTSNKSPTHCSFPSCEGCVQRVDTVCPNWYRL